MTILNKLIGDKKRYRQFKRDVAALPADYRDTLLAIEKYMWNFAKGEGFMAVLEGILTMFQENAADQVPITSLIGSDPVAFCDNIMAQYPDELWLITYQNRLRQTIQEIIADDRNQN
ncbi:DUF1048 domain-containing protein [Lapidilactobacillus wuchangensis]|uniref:DUF1048 domain-containing protein n=1 Tax=Lapidilactobacillus wuchangensis TaxID=2486001 RepID=UPI000F7ADF89|nr:DUF1048 domain-containing protein [Lapidilactobacillus wuchangensis]